MLPPDGRAELAEREAASTATAVDCPRCGTVNRAVARFCRGCGSALTQAKAPPRIDRFCDHCGAPLDAHRTPAQPHAAVPEDERKQVTVLFADICGSTRLVGGRDPEEARALLNAIIKMMIDAVHAYGGMVSQVQGDGILAFFGAPQHHEDHALRACHAALHMHENVAGASRELSPQAQIHVGVSSGEIVLSTIAFGSRLDLFAVGEMLHVGARLQQHAEPGETLLSGDTLRLVRDFVVARSRGQVPMRGLSRPVDVHELQSIRGVGARFHRAAARGLSPFINRRAELETLATLVRTVEQGQGRVAVLVGEAGIGKSRMVWELTRAPSVASWRVAEAGAVSIGEQKPYGPVAALLAALFGIEPADGEAEIQRKVVDAFAGTDSLPELAVPALLTAFGLSPQDPAWRAASALRRRGLVANAFVAAIRRVARDAPLIVVVEDLQWIDSDSRALLDALVRRAAGLRALVLLTYRPAFADPWRDLPHVRRIEIEPLSPSHTGDLARRLMKAAAGATALDDALIERAGGNPFFLEQIVHALQDTEQPGAPTAMVPASIHAVLGARIDRLDPADKRLLHAAAVVGRSFPMAVLLALTRRLDIPEPRAGLGRLVEAGLLRERSTYPQLEYGFDHVLTQEVAYAGLSQERRRALHVAALRALEEVHAERLDESADTLAYHARCGEAWEESARYAHLAGQRAASRSTHDLAARFFRQAVAAIDHLPSTPERLAQAIDIRFELRNSLFPLGLVAEDLEQQRRAEADAQRIGDAARLAWVSTFVARDLSLLGRPALAVDAAQRALEMAIAVRDANLQVLVQAFLGQARYALGDYPESAAMLERAVSSVGPELIDQRFGLPGPASVFFRAWLVWALARLGEFERGEEVAGQAAGIALATDQPLCWTVAEYSSGFLALHGGRTADAIERLQRAKDHCTTWGFPAWFTNVAAALGIAHAREGRIDEGIELIGQAVEKSRQLGIMVSHANEVCWLAEARLQAHDPSAAQASADRAIGLARQFGERGNEAESLLVRARVDFVLGAHDEARHWLAAATALARACAMKPLQRRCELLQRDLGAP